MKPVPSEGVNLKDHSPKLLDGKKWRVTEKIDGVRRMFYKSSMGDVVAYSKTGILDTGISHITSYLENPWFPYDMVYDCELVDKASYFSKLPSYQLRTTSTAKANSHDKKRKQDLIAICFDMFEPGGLQNGEARTRLLLSTFLTVPLSAPVIVVPMFGVIHGFDRDLIDAMMNMVAGQNGEGLMLMNMDSPYVAGRSNELVKIKHLQEFVGTIIDVELAGKDTKIAGGISALICEVEGCTIPVRVGTGFSHDLRREMARDSDLIGKVIEIDAFSRTVDKYGNQSLSMPVFKAFKEKE